MPFLRLDTTERLDDSAKRALCSALSRALSEVTGKPEQYVMVAVSDGLAMCHQGAPGPTAFVEVRAIGGLSPDVNATLSKRLCATLSETLGVPGARVFLNFTSVEGSNWGHNGSVFG